tara:strand:+ start:239 stop:529 length:291 start_codon:yes stop_codon:yes gene_type:complete
MPKGYLVGHFTLTDKARFMGEYGTKVVAVLEEFGGKLLVRGGPVAYREGESADLEVVVEFADSEAAQRCLQSEAYRTIKPGRTDNSTGRLVIVDGV